MKIDRKIKPVFLGMILFLLSVFTVWRNVHLHIAHFGGHWGILTYINLFQRSAALFAFIIIAFQIVLGAYRTRWMKKYGSWISEFYTSLNVFIYSLILAHVLSYFLFLIIAKKIIDPFYIFTDFCILCKTRSELFYSFGRFAFWLSTFAVFFGIFWKRGLLRRKWKIFYYVNYVIFFLVSIHAFFVGSDMVIPPFLYIFIISEFLFFLIVIQKTFLFFKRNFKLRR